MKINIEEIISGQNRPSLQGTQIPVVVHPCYNGKDRREAPSIISRDRDFILDGCLATGFTNSVEDEADHYAAYLERMRERVGGFNCSFGILVEALGAVEQTLQLLQATNPRITWIVITTPSRDNVRLGPGLDWEEVALVLAACGLLNAVVFGATDGARESCVPTVARELSRLGATAVTDPSASYQYKGKAE